MAKRNPHWRPEVVDNLGEETVSVLRRLIEQFEETTYTFSRLGRDLQSRTYNRPLREAGQQFDEEIADAIELYTEQMDAVQDSVGNMVEEASSRVRGVVQRTDDLEERLAQAETERNEWRERAERAEQQLQQERGMERRARLWREIKKVAGKSRTLQGLKLIKMEMM